MKAALCLALILCVFVASARSHDHFCVGHPHEAHDCSGAFDEGNGGEGCDENANSNMWYNNNGVCEPMSYNGCGGNGNRFCSQNGCESICGLNE